jgi:hypothetical protein
MLIASCTLTWERLPESVLPGFWFYAGVDLLIMMGVTRDLLVNRKIHRVNLIAAATFHARPLRSRSEGRQRNSTCHIPNRFAPDASD